MANGYTGQILRLDLTKQTTSIIETKNYEEWGGGNGIGTAIFLGLRVVKKRTQWLSVPGR